MEKNPLYIFSIFFSANEVMSEIKIWFATSAIANRPIFLPDSIFLPNVDKKGEKTRA